MKKNRTSPLHFAFVCAFTFAITSLSAQNMGDYRSVATGDWNNATTWETFDGLSWVAATLSPTATDGQITVQAAHTVTVNSTELIDETVIDGVLFVDATGFLEVQDDGTATNDLIINGTATVAGVLHKNQDATINSTAPKLTFDAGGTYEHNNTTSIGNIPLATWDPQSNCKLIGYNNTVGGVFATNNFGQAFGNFIWDCPNQNTNINLAGFLTTVNGFFQVMNTGTGQLRLSAGTSPTLSISGDFILDGGEFVLTNGTGSPVVNLNGNYYHNAGSFFSNGTASNPGVFNFVKNDTQEVVINPAAIMGGSIAWNVKNSGGFGPSKLKFMDDVSAFSSADPLSAFTLEGGTSIIILHPDGIASFGSTGCVQTGARNFADDAHYHYRGSQPQQTGTALPSNLTATLGIQNDAGLGTLGVVLSHPALLTGATSTLVLSRGKLTTSNLNLLTLDDDVTVIGGSADSYVQGPLRRYTNSTTAWGFPVGDDVHFKPVNILPTVSTHAEYTVAAHHQTPPLPNNVGGSSNTDLCSVSAVEYWEVSGSEDAQMQLFWHTYSGIDETAQQTCNNLTIAHLEGGSNQWQSLSVTQQDFTNDFLLSDITGNYNTQNHTFGFFCTATITAATTQPTCGLPNGAIDVTITNSTGNYTYSWFDGAATEDRSNLSDGTYTLVIDDGGCRDTATFTMNLTVAVVATSNSVTEPTCNLNNGAIDVDVAGGTGTLTYTWTNGANTEDLSNLAPGSYDFIVEDSLGCADTLNFFLTNQGGVTAFNDTTVVCPGSGSLTIDILNNDLGGLVPGSVTITSLPAAGTGTVVVNANGTVDFTPGASFGTFTTFDYSVEDTIGCVGTATVTVLNGNTFTPVATPSGPTTFCTGDSVILSSNSPTGNVWLPGGQTSQSITVYNSGTYTLTVAAGGCTVAAAPINVTVNPFPATPVVSAGGPTTFCQGGSLTLTSSVTTGIVWSPGGQTTSSITVNASGTYSVTATNAGCSVSSNSIAVTVNPIPATPTITPAGPLTICQGNSVTLTSSSATDNNWFPNGQSTQSINVSAGGSYSVTVTTNGCSATSTPVLVNVTAVGTQPTVSLSGPQNFCQGDSVTLTSSITSGITWSPGGQTTPSITVSNSGTYTVSVGGASGCPATSTPVVVTVLPVPAIPTISASGPTTFCQGGSVTLTSSSATGNTWHPGAQNTPAIIATTGGSYTVTVTNASGCNATSAPVNVNVLAVPPTPTITPIGNINLCAGSSVTLVTNAIAPFQWSNGQTSGSITVSQAGTYTVTATDPSGCTATSAPTVVSVLNAPPTPTISASGATTFCQGDSVTLTSSAATGNLWSNGQSTQSITVASSGTYSVTVTDANGCSATSSSTIVTVNPAPAVPTITPSSATICEGEAVTLTANGATSYSWNTGDNTASITANPIGTTTYTVTALSANGCTTTSAPTTVTVNPLPPVPTISTSGSTIFCQGGSVVLTSSAANGNLWSNGSTANSITVNTSGNFTLTVTDNNGCSATSATTNVQVNPNPPAPTISASGPLSFCFGGNVTLSSSAASGNNWSNGATTQNITVNSSGTYSVFVQDPNGCTSVAAQVQVTEVPQITANAFTVQNSGCSTNSGIASVNVAGGTGSFNFLWSTNPAQTTQTISGLAPGTYIVTVSDAANPNCFTTSSTGIQGGSTPNALLAPTGNLSICEGKDITFTAFGGSSYLWLLNGVAVGSGNTFVANQSGTYQVVAYSQANASGCVDTSATVNLVVVPAPQVNIMPLGPTEVCYENFVTLVGYGTNVNSFMWLLENQIMNIFTDTLTTGISGNYKVVGVNGCGNDTSATIFVNVHAKPVADFIYVPDPIYAQKATQFKDKSIHAAAWWWDFGVPGATSTFQNPIYTYETAGDYNVTLIVADDIGCADTLTRVLQVLDENQSGNEIVFVPNTFTPNGDGTHDELVLEYGSVSSTLLQIFDRWGNKVFETNSTSTHWNGGMKNNPDKPCEGGTYYYILTGLDSKEDKYVRKGFVTLLR